MHDARQAVLSHAYVPQHVPQQRQRRAVTGARSCVGHVPVYMCQYAFL